MRQFKIAVFSFLLLSCNLYPCDGASNLRSRRHAEQKPLKKSGRMLLPPSWVLNDKSKVSPVGNRISLVNLSALHPWRRKRTFWALAVLGTLASTSKTTRESVNRALYFWTHAGPMVVHYRFTQWWLTATHAPLEKRNVVYNNLHDRYCQPSLDLILHLKGLYVKFGQVLSSRPDMVPRQYITLYSTLQDAIPPWPVEKVETIARASLEAHGLDYEKVFESMEEVPLGSASIGQVHCAILKEPYDSHVGKVVAVKVMHPDAKTQFANDFSVFKWLCRVALPGWRPILRELEKQVMTEFDYRNEALALKQVKQNMDQSPYRKRIHVPQPVEELCTQHVLVMEMLEGKKLVESMQDKLAVALGGNEQAARDYLDEKRNELFVGKEQENELSHRGGGFSNESKTRDKKMRSPVSLSRQMSLYQRTRTALKLLSLYKQMRGYLDLLLDVHGHQIFIDGCFNGDPHPGNVLEMPNGKLGLIDYGQCKRLENKDRLAMARIVALLGQDVLDEENVANAMREFGFQTKLDRNDVLTKYAALFFDSDIEGKRKGFATPQLYLMHLTSLDPLIHVPDPAVFVARASFLFRGMGGMLEEQLQTAKWWSSHAEAALSQQQQ